MMMTTTTRSSNSTNQYLDLLWKFYHDWALNPTLDYVWMLLLLMGECILCYLIIGYVSYTEIDWIAYMEEVEMWYVEGEYNYRNIRGNTGPLVYPAGFLYLFALLRYWTNLGTNIRTAQYIFMIFYLLIQLCVLYIYQQTIQTLRDYYPKLKKVLQQQPQQEPQQQQANDAAHSSSQSNRMKLIDQLCHDIWMIRIAMMMICLSKRLHSIFILRLFNDGPTMLLFYISLVCFIRHYWNIGCVIFSLAVSIKMNVLLFAPGLLLLLLQISPNLPVVIIRLLLCCALPQIILGLPFLLSYPESYIRKAFELDRVFFYKWTVNWKFLPESIFLSKQVSILLLLLHIVFLFICGRRWLQSTQRMMGKGIFLVNHNDDLSNKRLLSAPYITSTLFVANFIGICFARSIHYQFYCWYFHSIPYLLCCNCINRYINAIKTESNSNNNKEVQKIEQYHEKTTYCYHPIIQILIIGMIEISYLTFPATPVSSFILQVAHYAILFQIQPLAPMLICDDDTGVMMDDNKKKS